MPPWGGASGSRAGSGALASAAPAALRAEPSLLQTPLPWESLETSGASAWSREPCIPPYVGTVSELPNLAVAERSRLWGQGLYRSTPLLKTSEFARFSQAA